MRSVVVVRERWSWVRDFLGGLVWVDLVVDLRVDRFLSGGILVFVVINASSKGLFRLVGTDGGGGE